jgi:phage recombination protein Bet
MTNVATLEQPKRSVLVSMSSHYGMEPAAFEATLRATVVPPNTSKEQFAAFLLVAKQYGLNPVTKEIYAFPTKGGGIQPIVGIDGWMNLINSHPSCDGIEFKDEFDDQRQLVAITAIIHRKDRKHPTMVTEYMGECKRSTEPWQKWPARMLRHKAAIQCARYAFGFAGIIDPEEAERSPEVITSTIAPPPPPAAQIAAPVAEHIDVDAEPAFDVEAFMATLFADLEAAKTPELVAEVWDAADVERRLSGMDDRLEDAFTMKRDRLEALAK